MERKHVFTIEDGDNYAINLAILKIMRWLGSNPNLAIQRFMSGKWDVIKSKNDFRLNDTPFVIKSCTFGDVNAFVKKITEKMSNYYDDPNEAIGFFIGDEWDLFPSCYEKDGVIYFSVVSLGMTMQDWYIRLKAKGVAFHVSDWLDENFRKTNGAITDFAILRGSSVANGNLTTKNIRIEGDNRNLKQFSGKFAESALQIIDIFSSYQIIKDMGLSSLVLMSDKTIKISKCRNEELISIDHQFGDRVCLMNESGNDDSLHNKKSGFIFRIN